LKQIVSQYLSRTHRDEPTGGCAVVALGSELTRTDGAARAVMDSHLKKYFQKISAALGGENEHELAIPIVCMLNGALTLSRLIDDKSLSDKVLKEARDFILAVAQDKSARTKASGKPTRRATQQ
jgi:TetR/AcrR family transcriptional repressor of nem operon